MIILYSGTPGSGKSLDVARQILLRAKRGQNYIGNMIINQDSLKECKGRYIYVDTYALHPTQLVEYAKKYHERGIEGQTVLVIDECQQIFNSRDWKRPIMKAWNSFFQIHRHLGYDVYLITQYDRLIDRQIRALIEYERIHRKISNIGFYGKLMSLFSGGKLFVCVERYYSMNLKTGSYFFRYKEKYSDFYDSYSAFNDGTTMQNDLLPLLVPEKGIEGSPSGTDRE